MKTNILVIAISLTIIGCTSKDQSGVEKKRGKVNIEGSELAFTVEGQGPNCIVLGSKTYYRRIFSKGFKDIFQVAFTDTRMFTADAKGPSNKPYDMSVMVEDIEAFRKYLDWEEFFIVGHSLHAFAAIEYARTYPQHITGAIMIGMAPRWPSKKDQAALWESDASEERRNVHQHNQKVLEQVQADSSLSPGQKFIQTYILNSALYWNDPHYDATQLWESVDANMELFNEWVVQSGRDYRLSNGKPVDKPVLVGVGKKDFAAPWDLWDDQAKSNLPDLTFAVFEESGHTPPFEEPERFNDLVREWVAQ